MEGCQQGSQAAASCSGPAAHPSCETFQVGQDEAEETSSTSVSTGGQDHGNGLQPPPSGVCCSCDRWAQGWGNQVLGVWQMHCWTECFTALLVMLACNSCCLGNSSDADVIVTWLCEHMDEVPSAPPAEEGEEEEEDEEEEEGQQEGSLTQPPKEANPKPPAMPADAVVDNESDSDSDEAQGNNDSGVDVPESDTSDTAGYKSPADFSAKSDYASYVKDNVRVGASVECCESYEHIKVGDSGKVTKVSQHSEVAGRTQ